MGKRGKPEVEATRPPGVPRGATPWPGVADFAVPAALAVFQLVGNWGLAELNDLRLAQGRWMVAIACVVAGCVALIWRRTAPEPVLAAAIACSAVAVLAMGTTDSLVSGLADGVALYSLAVHRGRGPAMVGGALMGGVAVASTAPLLHGPADFALNAVLSVLAAVVITALGQLRREYKRRRQALAEQLAEAERAHRAAAGTERERLARDLHDVAGHHLSAVVVHSGAVARGGDAEMAREALSAAADTGRDVLRALTRLVDVMGPDVPEGGLDASLPQLCQGLTRLGVPVSLAVEGRVRRLRPEVDTAAYRIVQESLTNAMRYAPGAPVTVEVRHVPGAVELTVANEAPGEDATVPALGTGRGITGMGERARSLGGTLDAGPSGGGWTVRASLPTSAGNARHRLGWPEVLDATVAAACATAPPLLAFTPPDPLLGDASPGLAALVIVLLLLRGVPLWWRRRAPYLALGALAALDIAAALTVGPHSQQLLALLVIGAPAEMVAVYAVAGHARRGPTWPAPFVGAVPWAVVFTTLIVTDPETEQTSGVIPFGLGTGWGFGLLVLLPFWAWGRAVTGRGHRWEATARETMAAREGEAVQAERNRVALGLRATVLDHTARLVRSAEAGLSGTGEDARAALDAVTELARAALLDMRALLDALERE
ncbi:sensor histidine kinase [Actinomadura terrae]|uniref:sensor histidine kinase n=1 Tax=Actinomadura terrae TaxID=604353 RepID=UPI001FA6F33C|nr:histidine kinase [Actinomadura terrae]